MKQLESKIKKFGMPTLIELDDWESNIELCRKLKLKMIEINMNLPQFQSEQIKLIQIPENIEISIHLPEDTDIWTFNHKIRQTYIQNILDVIEIAKTKNVKILNLHMHLGIYFTLPMKKIFLYEKYYSQYMDATNDFAEIISKSVKETEIKIYIENTGIYNRNYITSAVKHFLNFECFRLTWDIGHDYSSGNADMNFLLLNKEKIGHIHIHDAIGKNNHLVIGDGEIIFNDIFSNFAENNSLTAIIETKTIDGLEKSVKYLRSKKIIQ